MSPESEKEVARFILQVLVKFNRDGMLPSVRPKIEAARRREREAAHKGYGRGNT